MQFKVLATLVLGFGSALSLLYLCTVHEVRMENTALILEAKYQHALDRSVGRDPLPLPDSDEDILRMQRRSLHEKAEPAQEKGKLIIGKD